MKHAVYSGTRNVYDDMEMSAKALVANSDVDKVHFLIEDETFPRPLPDIIECHDVSGQDFFLQDGPNMESRYTYMAMMRIALCHVLPELDKVLALDTDTVCVADIGDMWDWPLDGCYFAAAQEWDRSENGLQYCNFGVVLYNLEMMRDGKANECVEVLNKRRYPWVEQDVGNYLCQGRIYEMPLEYNSNWYTDKNLSKRKAKIVHYAGIRHDDWIRKPQPRKYRRMTWSEALRRHG